MEIETKALDQLGERLEKSIGAQVDSVNTRLDKSDERAAELEKKVEVAVALNERMEALEEGQQKLATDLDEAADEIRQRLSLREKVADPRGRYNLDADGRVVPTLSDDAARAVHKLAKRIMSVSEVNNLLELMKEDRDLPKQDDRDLGSGSTATGGALLHDEYVPEILGLVTVYGDARKYFRVVPMSQKTQTYPAFDGDGTDAQWVSEGSAPGSNTEPAFKTVQITNEILMALAGIPISLMQDANPAIGQLVAEFIARKFGKAEDIAGFKGAGGGIGSQDPFTGVLNDANVNSKLLNSGTTYQESTADDFLQMQASVETAALDGAAYYVQRTLQVHLQGLKDKNGRFIYQEPTASKPATLWNYPIRLVECLPKTSDASQSGKPFAIFGNLQYAFMGDRAQVVIGSSEHAGWSNLKVITRGFERVGMKVGVPEGLVVLTTN